MFEKLNLGELEKILMPGDEVVVVEFEKFKGTNFTTYGTFESIDSSGLLNLGDNLSLPYGINVSEENCYALKAHLDDSRNLGFPGFRRDNKIDLGALENISIYRFKEE